MTEKTETKAKGPTLAEVRAARHKAAYKLVDISDLPDEVRLELINDAQTGGGLYGVEVVESVINGPVSAPIFGVYSHNEDKWAEAKAELGLSASEVPDTEVESPAEADFDPRAEAALRQQATENANALAERIRQGDDAAIAQVTGEPPAPPVAAPVQPAAAADRPARPRPAPAATTNKAPR